MCAVLSHQVCSALSEQQSETNTELMASRWGHKGVWTQKRTQLPAGVSSSLPTCPVT